MTVIGLTGPTGSGKTLFSSLAEEQGFYIINADETAHRTLTEPEAAAALASAFGEDILVGGIPDRKRLAAVAFADRESTERLNSVFLPFVVNRIREQISQSGAAAVLLDAPTLYESGLASICELTVAITADREVRLGRIMERDGLGEPQAVARISAGRSDAFFKERADIIIYNNGALEDFKNECKGVILKLADKCGM